jgi:hypothetical protein
VAAAIRWLPIAVPPQRGGALGDDVAGLLQHFGQFVEELIQLEEVHAFDVPMRMLGLAVEVQRVGQLLVQQAQISRLASRGRSISVENIRIFSEVALLAIVGSFG